MATRIAMELMTIAPKNPEKIAATIQTARNGDDGPPLVQTATAATAADSS